MKLEYRIESNKIYLRTLNDKDATEKYCEWLNDSNVNKYLETKKANIDEIKNYILEKNESCNCLFLGIFDKSNDAHIGNLKLEPIDFENKKATFSIMVGDRKYWNRGIGTEATSLIINYAWNTLKLDSIDLGVVADNKRAIRVYEKVGFRVIMIVKKAIKHEDKVFDKVIMKITKIHPQMKFLIIGCGSIGKRHISNLIKIGYTNIEIFDLDNSRMEDIKKNFNVKKSNNVFDSIKNNDNIIICTPNNLHREYILAAAQNNKNIFVEKPILDNLENIESIKNAIEKNNIKLQVGYNLIYHPLILKIKEILDNKELGDIYGARLEYGSYLPNWRPNTEYWTSYSAKKSMGGGILLDAIHEINYSVYLFGRMKKLFCFANKNSDLNINTEDNAELLLKSTKDYTINIHLDYLQRKPNRTIKIICNKGNIEADINKNLLRIIEEHETKKYEIEYDYNETYIEEITSFISSIVFGKKIIMSLDEGIYDVRLVLSAKESSDKGVMIEL